VLYGDWNPSGKLAFTIAHNATDYNGGIITDSNPTSESPPLVHPWPFLLLLVLTGIMIAIKQIPYTERVDIDYRHFDAVSSDEPSAAALNTKTERPVPFVSPV
jgi:beta-glucosidase